MTQSRKRISIVVSAIVVAVIVMVPSVYVLYLKPKPIEMTVDQGAKSYTFIGDFFNYTSVNPIFFDTYGCTTLISEKGHGNFSINASMFGNAYGYGTDNHFFGSGLFFTLNGTLPYNINPSAGNIMIRPLNGSTQSFKSDFYATDYQTAPTPGQSAPKNVTTSFAPGSSFYKLDLNFQNDTGLKPKQTFNFSIVDFITFGDTSPPTPNNLQYNTTYGISVTASLSGLSKPVSVTLYLFFIDVPKG